MRRIDEDDLVAPSKRVDPQVAGARGTTVVRLRRELAGDFDAIAAKALRSRPANRYGSVPDLIEDVRRRRDLLPIRARRDSWHYRAGRALRRHWFGVTMSGLLIGSLVAGSVMSMRGRQAAEQQAHKAELVSDLLLGLFDLSSPNASAGQTIDAGDLLDEGVRRVEVQFADRPDLQIELFQVLGAAYMRLGRLETAQQLLERSVRLGGLDADRPGLGDDLLRLDLAEVARLSARYEEAQGLYEQILERVERSHPRSRLASDVYNGLGTMHSARGEYDAARVWLGRSLDILRDLRQSDEVRLETARALSNLALVHASAGELKLAEHC